MVSENREIDAACSEKKNWEKEMTVTGYIKPTVNDTAQIDVIFDSVHLVFPSLRDALI